MSSRYLPDAVEQERRQREWRELARGARYVKEIPAPDWTERMIDVYPDPERQDWMRRELARWRGER